MLGLFQGGSEAPGQSGFMGLRGTPRGCPSLAPGTRLPTAPSQSRASPRVQPSLPAHPFWQLGEPQSLPPASARSILPTGGRWRGPSASRLQPPGSGRPRKKFRQRPQMSDPAWRDRLGPSMGPLSPHRALAWGPGPGQPPVPRLGPAPWWQEPAPQLRCTPKPPGCPPSQGWKMRMGLPRALSPPHGPAAAGGGGHASPASAPFCRSAAFDPPKSGAFKEPRRRAEAGEEPHTAPAAGEGGQGAAGGQELGPGTPIPPHSDAASGGRESASWTQDNTQHIKQFPIILFQTPALFPSPPTPNQKKPPSVKTTLEMSYKHQSQLSLPHDLQKKKKGQKTKKKIKPQNQTKNRDLPASFPPGTCSRDQRLHVRGQTCL